MITFIVLAAVLTFAAATAIAVPLLKKSPAGTEQSSWTAFAVVGVMVFGAAALYATFSNWSWNPQQPQAHAQGSTEAMVAQLARRLERNPNDLEGWLMLGRSYMALDQYELAERAFERADSVAGGKSADALTGLAEALVVQDDSALEGRAGELIERSLQIDANSGKALFLGAAAAIRRGELPLARERFVALLAQNPPENVRPILQEQIDAIDQQLGTSNTSATASTQSDQSAASGKTQDVAAEAQVRVRVTLSPQLNVSVPPSAPLFVFVRDPMQGGPPLAVKRLPNQLPQTVELSSKDSMVPGREIKAGQQVLVVARIARSGGATAQSGDPYGEARYHVGKDGLVEIVIDKVQP